MCIYVHIFVGMYVQTIHKGKRFILIRRDCMADAPKIDIVNPNTDEG